MTAKYCALCRAELDPAEMAKHPTRRFCSRACYAAWRKGNRQATANARAATSEANRKRWEKWRDWGIDPTHGGQAAQRRGEKIAASNAAKPRRRKRNETQD